MRAACGAARYGVSDRRRECRRARRVRARTRCRCPQPAPPTVPWGCSPPCPRAPRWCCTGRHRQRTGRETSRSDRVPTTAGSRSRAGSDHRVSSKVSPRARETQGINESPACFSASLRYRSRWVTAPRATGIRHSPQTPRRHRLGTSYPRLSSASNSDTPESTVNSSPVEAFRTANGSPGSSAPDPKCSTWIRLGGQPRSVAAATTDSMNRAGPQTYRCVPNGWSARLASSSALNSARRVWIEA